MVVLTLIILGIIYIVGFFINSVGILIDYPKDRKHGKGKA